MVQSINTKAILTLASILKRQSLIVPHVSVANISELNFSAIHQYVDAVIFDKDNTLTSPYENHIHPKAAKGLQNAMDVFGTERVAILSNSAGTLDDVNYRDATAIENALGVRVIRHDEKKPGGIKEVLHHFNMNSDNADNYDDDDDHDVGEYGKHKDDATVPTAAKICIIGDRLLTDVVFGNLHGMLTIHTLPLCVGMENQNDNQVSACIRSIENRWLYSNPKRAQRYQRLKLPHKYWPGTTEEAPLVL